MFCGSFTTCGELVLVLGLLGLSQGAIIALNAVGLTMVYGAT